MKSVRGLRLLSLVLFLGVAHAHGAPWIIRKTNWSEMDERLYSEFVTAIGRSRCHSIDACLKSSDNLYRGNDSPQWRWSADCAKLPYVLRAYFAWKNGLPFSYDSEVEAVDGGGDLRYSPKGNRPTAKVDITNVADAEPQDGHSLILKMVNEVYSAMFRFHPSLDSRGELYPDFYPVGVQRGAIVPGTMIYDPNGHVAVVYEVEDSGRIRYVDAHPDNSMTRGVFDERFVRSNPGMGAGFKNWRPLELVGAQHNGDQYIGGSVVALANQNLPHYSLEQFYGTQPSADKVWSKGQFDINGTVVDFYEFVRMRLATSELRYDPVGELTSLIHDTCGYFQDRVHAVERAIAAGLSTQPHPARLPKNIYGTDGDWEEYSTPARDAELKTTLRAMRIKTQQLVEWQRSGSKKVVYTGNNLAQDLRAAYERETSSCQITYLRSDRTPITLNYKELIKRSFAFSFDPYNCAELRWGANSSSELATCRDDSNKYAWYAAEQSLRNQLDRTYDVRMDYSLDDLQRPKTSIGVATPPDIDVGRYLDSLD